MQKDFVAAIFKKKKKKKWGMSTVETKTKHTKHTLS